MDQHFLFSEIKIDKILRAKNLRKNLRGKNFDTIFKTSNGSKIGILVFILVEN